MFYVDTNEWLKPYKGSMVEDFGEISDEEKAKIMHFLRGGTRLFMFKNNKSDLIFPDSVEGPSRNLRTDGVWVWGKDVGYYVRKYSIRPPADFMKHMEEVDYRVAFVDDKQLAEAVSFAMSNMKI